MSEQQEPKSPTLNYSGPTRTAGPPVRFTNLRALGWSIVFFVASASIGTSAILFYIGIYDRASGPILISAGFSAFGIGAVFTAIRGWPKWIFHAGQ